MVNHEIEKIYDSYINNTFRNHRDVREYMLKHERKQKFLENVIKEVKEKEWSLGVKLTHSWLTKLVEEGARLFCLMSLNKLEQDRLTESEKIRRINEYDRNNINKIENAEDCEVKEL